MVENAEEVEVGQLNEPKMTLEEMCFEVVCAAVRCNNPNSFSVAHLVADFAGAILNLGVSGLEEAKEAEKEEWNKENSIQDEFVVCLECGLRSKQISSSHMKKEHGLTIDEYKKKWGFKKKDSLMCLNTLRKRRKSGKKRGLPDGLIKFQEARRAEKALSVGEKTSSESTPASQKVETRRRRPAEKANKATE